MNKIISLLLLLAMSAVFPITVFASKCGPNKIEVFYPEHTENEKKIQGVSKCVSKKDWKMTSKKMNHKNK